MWLCPDGRALGKEVAAANAGVLALGAGCGESWRVRVKKRGLTVADQMTLSSGDTALFAAAVPPARQAVAQAVHLLDLIARSVAPLDHLAGRLAPDMMDCAGQLRTTGGFALRATFPLTRREMPVARFSDDLRGLRAGLVFAGAEIAALGPQDFAGAAGRPVAHRAGEADLVQAAGDYLHLFALPNLWFHLAMAYAILRQRDVPVGKADFDGWHRYRG
jgi:uncharacterized protein